ncbi:hypothetical protein SETIT_1G152300v2 [Setaria italica]|uniref:Microtubule-binding protein TANGLED1 n=1 Tax=Setaria italica TaxID=4555 RepID=A0A368PL13_SETIT|nr:hypothetical protein SETIT_1G152300v2 [Setaria italica]
MSLPAMLLGETVLEIVQASQFARDIVAVAGATNREPPRTPKPAPRTRKPAAAEQTPSARGAPGRSRAIGAAARRVAPMPPRRLRAAKQKRSYKTRSPVAARQTPHKFLVKTPPSALGSKLRSHGKALPARSAAVSPPPPKAQASPAKTRRCSFSPSRLATRLVSPIKARLSLGRSRDSGVGAGGGPMSGLKQRPGVNMTVRTVSSRISSR